MRRASLGEESPFTKTAFHPVWKRGKSVRKSSSSPRRKKTAPTPKAPQNAAPTPFDQLPEALRQKVGAVEGLSLVLRVLGYGLYTGQEASRVENARRFVQAIFDNARKELEEDPTYDTHFPNMRAAEKA
jgi:hypothetical protein